MAKKTLTFERHLNAVPIVNRHLTEHRDTQGDVVIDVELVYPFWARPLARLLRLRRTRGFVLDEIGLAVYRAIDGRRSVEDLIDAFADTHKLTFFEARAFLGQYLRTLMKHGLIAIGVPRTD